MILLESKEGGGREERGRRGEGKRENMNVFYMVLILTSTDNDKYAAAETWEDMLPLTKAGRTSLFLP